MNTNFVVINKANELYDYSFRYILNCLKGNGNSFRNSLENELYELIHNIYRANINYDNERIRKNIKKSV